MDGAYLAHVRSNIVAMDAVLGTGVEPKHVVRTLNQFLWDITQFSEARNHKHHGLRYRTRAAEELVRVRASGLRHEHVVEREFILKLALTDRSKLEALLCNMPTALVTEAEHRQLRKGNWDSCWGWERYAIAGLELVDAESREVLDLDNAADDLRRVYEPIVGRPGPSPSGPPGTARDEHHRAARPAHEDADVDRSRSGGDALAGLFSPAVEAMLRRHLHTERLNRLFLEGLRAERIAAPEPPPSDKGYLNCRPAPGRARLCCLQVGSGRVQFFTGSWDAAESLDLAGFQRKGDPPYAVIHLTSPPDVDAAITLARRLSFGRS